MCGGGPVVTKTLTPPDPPLNVETTFTYTISIENLTSFDMAVDNIVDFLPPAFTYVANSTDSGSFWPNEPTVTWKAQEERYQLDWVVSQAATIPAGGTVTQTFQAKATPDTGVDYYNEAWVEILDADCVNCPYTPGNSTKTSTSGPSGGSFVEMPTIYDIQAIASDGTVLSRVLIEADGEVDILSWQEQ